MIRVTRISSYASQGSARTRSAWESVQRQPGWLMKVTVLAFFIVVGLPLLLLFLLALLVATVVFGVLLGVNFLIMAARGVLPGGNDGRENVRVIRRD